GRNSCLPPRRNDYVTRQRRFNRLWLIGLSGTHTRESIHSDADKRGSLTSCAHIYDCRIVVGCDISWGRWSFRRPYFFWWPDLFGWSLGGLRSNAVVFGTCESLTGKFFRNRNHDGCQQVIRNRLTVYSQNLRQLTEKFQS